MPKKKSKTSKPMPQSPVVPNWEMSKESSSKPPKPVIQKKPSPSSTPKTFGHEIEEIFSKKRKNPEKPNKLDQKDKDGASLKRKKKKSKSGGSNVDMFENEERARPKRKTGDGLVIYTEEELGIGKVDAGGTRLCPFDCDCCF